MEYLPFGETLVEEHQNSYNTPYKFNAKELDDETGNYYYGARYYNPKFSIWLSVDPLAETMPSWSPYNYTFNNPVRFTDPTGMAPEWEPLGNGRWKAEAGDSASTLARDAGISFEKAKEIMANTPKSNSSLGNMGTYRDTDGVVKSAVDPGDTVTVSEQQANTSNTVNTVNTDNSITFSTGIGAKNEQSNSLDMLGLAFVGVAAEDISKVLDGSTMRLFNQKGINFSPKLYTSGWNGGSVGHIKTYGTTNLAKSVKVGGNLLGIYGLYNTYDSYTSGKRNGVGASVDAGYGVVGFMGWPGAVISTSYELGKSFGPSTWFGKNDNKWFK